MIVVLAEKPSVARDIASVLGATEKRAGWMEGSGYQVTWALGHLVGIAQPHEINPEWIGWRSGCMLPERFPLVLREGDGYAERVKVIERLFNARGTKEIVCATDAGREGELIFRLIYEFVECQKSFRRLWISSLTPDAIKEGFRSLKPGAAYDALGAAARIRSESDWLVGMNLSRAYTRASGEKHSVGRVKTPTLAMVVYRDMAIEEFKPRPYREVEGTFATEVGEVKATYVRGDFNKKGQPILNAELPPVEGNPPDPLTTAELIVARARVGAASVKQVEEEKKAIPAPMLFDLTELQRTANRLWGWTAARTLQVAQELYERHKVLSYPRTDSRHLSKTVAETLGGIVRVVRTPYEEFLGPETGTAKLSGRFINDAKVSDHHAIIPTGTPPSGHAQGSEAALLYDLVCRRFLAAWQADAIEASTKVDFVVASQDGQEDRYQAKGKAVLRAGWRSLDLTGRNGGERESSLPGGLRRGLPATVRGVRIANKETRPPDFFNEATLLTGMESAGASLEGEISDAMKERGLGTPATRASIIEELVARGYIERKGKQLRATEFGTRLVRRVHKHVASPSMTGEWELKLRRIERARGQWLNSTKRCGRS
jgi:DNA topoisomerase-3